MTGTEVLLRSKIPESYKHTPSSTPDFVLNTLMD